MSTIDQFYLRDTKFIADFEQNATGDLIETFGLANVKEALIRRFMTVKGALIHRPEYGASIPLYQNAPQTLDTRRKIANEINEQALLDSRVEEVLGVGIQFTDQAPEKTVITVRAKLVGYGEEPITFRPFGE